jgi:hypothetical protein
MQVKEEAHNLLNSHPSQPAIQKRKAEIFAAAKQGEMGRVRRQRERATVDEEILHRMGSQGKLTNKRMEDYLKQNGWPVNSQHRTRAELIASIHQLTAEGIMELPADDDDNNDSAESDNEMVASVNVEPASEGARPLPLPLPPLLSSPPTLAESCVPCASPFQASHRAVFASLAQQFGVGAGLRYLS